MTPLTRRDRAALVLALHVLRNREPARMAHDIAHDAECMECAELAGEVLALGGIVSRTLATAYDEAGFAIGREMFGTHPNWWGERRQAVAATRLVLVIRAVLRADAGDFGPKDKNPMLAWLAYRQGRSGLSRLTFREWVRANAPRWSRRIRPLWESAKPCAVLNGA